MDTLGTSRLIASRSSTVNVFVPVSPVPLRTPPTFCAPALTKSRLVPMLEICACTEACAPWPMLTMAITADTPMMMPSMVSAARILLRTSARKATRIIIIKFMFLVSSHQLQKTSQLLTCAIPRSCTSQDIQPILVSLVVFIIIVLDDGQQLQFLGSIALILDLVILLDFAVFENYDS